MHRKKFGLIGVSAVLVAGCGGGTTTFANDPRPPLPVNLTVYIDNARVSVSPSSVGAGPVSFIVTNQADKTESLSVQAPGGGSQLATTGPINPQATAQVTVDFRDPGDYTVSTNKVAATDAAQAALSPIQSATVHIGPARPSASNQLLQP
jgi:hypothetical protein